MSFPRYPEYKSAGVKWLGKIPEHWNIKPLKNVASFNDDVLPEKTPEDLQIKYVEISDVDEHKGIVGSSIYTFGSAPSRARRRVKDGDILISTVRTYLRAIAPVQTPPGNLVVSTGFAVIRPDPAYFHSALLGYMLRAEWFISNVIASSVGISYPAINASDLVRFRIPVPPVEEQAQIAGFLDHETARIDALIEEQQRLIELLKEKRQAVISHAVTKGLDPDVPMKDSGVEWLGEVPEYWEVKPLRYIGTLQNGITISGSAFGSGYPFVSYGDVYKNDVLPVKVKGLVKSSRGDRRNYSVQAGDVFFTRTSETVEEIGVSATCIENIENAVFAGFLIRFRPLKDTLSSSFSKYYFGNERLRDFFNKEMNLVTRASLGQGLLKKLAVAVPPRHEQAKISKYLDSVNQNLDDLIAHACRSTELLTERRSALISAAVTGKIDVRSWKAPAEVHTELHAKAAEPEAKYAGSPS